jgi:hypothetical protein
MILLDWTRMGRSYCLAGAVWQGGQWRIVRPLQAHVRDAPVRNVGWSAWLMDEHCRWEIFQLIHPVPAPPEPPHLEDIYVHSLRERRILADPAQRRAILHATLPESGLPPFGAPLTFTRAAAFLTPGTGLRSLSSVMVLERSLWFTLSRREGAAEPDLRVSLDVPQLAGRMLPVKDHFLLRQAELASSDPDMQLRTVERAVQQMGDLVVVRLGLSRAYAASEGAGAGQCWLMADGFFSLLDPQP